jgi:AcrR family transcriptional regulator
MAQDNEIRNRILAFSRDKFMQVGFSKVTLDEIASELGMSKKTLYKYFESKEQLLTECVSQSLQTIDENSNRIVSSDQPFTEKIVSLVTLIGSQFGHLSKAGAGDLQRCAPDQWIRIETFRREKMLMRVGGLIAQGKAEGFVRTDIPDELIQLILLSSVQGIVTPEVLMQHSFSVSDALRAIFSTVFEGILTVKGKTIISPLHQNIGTIHT